MSLTIQSIKVGAQKIDETTLKTHEIVVAIFSIIDPADKVKFFKETFLIANVSPDMVFGMLFLTLSSRDIDFLKKKLW